MVLQMQKGSLGYCREIVGKRQDEEGKFFLNAW